MWVRTDFNDYIAYVVSFLVPHERGVEIVRETNRQNEDTSR